MLIHFTTHNQTFTGWLGKVSGAGSSAHYFLSIDNYHQGQLFYSEHANAWLFRGHNPLFDDLGFLLSGWVELMS